MTNRWQKFSTSIFSVMTELANKYSAVNLAQGFPSFDGPEEILHEAQKCLLEKKNQYAPAPGILPLREAVSQAREKIYNLKYDPQKEVTIFSGATEAIFCAIMTHCNPGDEVVLFEPFYDSYPASIFAAHAQVKCVALEPPDWQISRSKLLNAISEKTKIIVINNPHNPTGRIFSRSELEIVAQVAIEKNLIIISDEVYEAIYFTNDRPLSISELPGMRERTIVISSTSKTFSITGWKVGYAFAPENLTQSLRALHQFVVFCSAHPLQWGALAAFKLGDSYFSELIAMYKSKRDRLKNILTEFGFKILPCEGTYFLIADYSKLSDMDDIAFSQFMTQECKVAVIPLAPFFQSHSNSHKLVRFAFCKDDEILSQAEVNLKTFLQSNLSSQQRGNNHAQATLAT